MKKLILISILVGLLAVPALATPTLQFSKTTPPGGWTFDNTGTTDTLSYSQEIKIIDVQGGSTDALYGAFVYIPTMTVGGSSGAWTVTGGTITIETQSDSLGTVILSGTLGSGNLEPSGITAGAYTVSQSDIIWGSYVGGYSPVAYDMWTHGSADFELTLSGGPSGINGPDGFEEMLDGTLGTRTWSDGLSGTMTIPAPGIFS